MSEGERELHAVIFRLTDLTEGKQLDLVYAGVAANDLLQREHILTVIVDRGDDDLTDGDGNILFAQIIEKIQSGFHGTADVFTVERFARIFDVQKNAVGLLQKRFDRIVQNASRGVKAGIDAVCVAEREDLAGEIGLQERLAARKGDTALLAEIFTVTQNLAYDLLGGIFRAVGECPRVGIMAAFAAQMTALEKYDEADAGTVHRAEALKRMDASHILTWIRGRYG